jgi:hypothetical protein
MDFMSSVPHSSRRCFLGRSLAAAGAGCLADRSPAAPMTGEGKKLLKNFLEV